MSLEVLLSRNLDRLFLNSETRTKDDGDETNDNGDSSSVMIEGDSGNTKDIIDKETLRNKRNGRSPITASVN